MENSRTPISSGEEDALNHIEQYRDAAGNDQSITQKDAITYLIEQDVEQTDARAHIKQLLLKGYLYEVDGELRIPPRP
ncbi:hypothetical protein [Halocatena marina]|uniref:hypothetical protein n=1 Tax=Halocatena marina TaxID=2934937 RepID=UPI00200FAA28|nr:hypothetical protein [Halocatena marina]